MPTSADTRVTPWRRRQGRRLPTRRRVAVVGLPPGVALLAVSLMAATPAWASGEHTGASASRSPMPAVLGLVLLVSTAVLAGAGLLRPMSEAPSPAAHRVLRVATGLAMITVVAAMLYGAVNVLTATAHGIVVLAVSTLLNRRVGAFVVGLLLTAILVVETAFAPTIVDVTIAPAYLVGAEALLGTTLAVVTTGSPVVNARRLAPVAMVATVAAAGFGVSQAVMPATARQHPSPEPGVPFLLEIDVAGQHLPVLLTPNRPGRNLVLVGAEADGVRVGSDPGTLVTASERAGAGGRWAVVDLPAGRTTLWVERAGDRASVDLDAGNDQPAGRSIAGPDGPECASAALGGALTGSTRPLPSCPADALASTDEASLRGLVGFLAGRGVRTLAVAADGSARSTAAAAAVRDAAQHRRLTIQTEPTFDSALVVVSGWEAATATLTSLAGQQRTGAGYPSGTYLAPWLLSAPVVTTISGAMIPLRFDPRDEQPVRYQLALDTRFHGDNPTASGYQGWLAATGSPQPSVTRLYAASLVSFLPKEVGMGHHGHDGGWLPGGTVVPVSGPLDDR